MAAVNFPGRCVFFGVYHLGGSDPVVHEAKFLRVIFKEGLSMSCEYVLS